MMQSSSNIPPDSIKIKGKQNCFLKFVRGNHSSNIFTLKKEFLKPNQFDSSFFECSPQKNRRFHSLTVMPLLGTAWSRSERGGICSPYHALQFWNTRKSDSQLSENKPGDCAENDSAQSAENIILRRRHEIDRVRGLCGCIVVCVFGHGCPLLAVFVGFELKMRRGIVPCLGLDVFCCARNELDSGEYFGLTTVKTECSVQREVGMIHALRGVFLDGFGKRVQKTPTCRFRELLVRGSLELAIDRKDVA